MSVDQKQILIVDDEPDIRELLEITLARMGNLTHSAANISQAHALLKLYEFDLCLTDMRLPDGNGIELVKHISQNYPALPVAMITAHGNMESAIEALKAGAFDFVSKPVDLQMLRSLINSALRLNAAELTEQDEKLLLLGDSDAMQRTRNTINKLARSQAPVYISGESGVGKELVARLIHSKGPRQDRPFVPVNCGAIPGELMESEFFGDGERILRAQKGQLYRRRRRQGRTVPERRRRHPVPGRSRRLAFAHAGQTVTCHSGESHPADRCH